MRRFVSLILAIFMAASLGIFSYAGGSLFTDVAETRWSYDSIIYAVEKGYMNGVGGGKFNPSGTLNRAMVVTVLWRAEGEPETGFEGSYSSFFSDLKDEAEWFSDAVVWAAENGVVNGYEDGTFRPKANITREQLAAMLCRYAAYRYYKTDASADFSSYTDTSKIHDYALEAMSWANAKGLITGVTDTSLNPRGNATREQFAAIMKRFDDMEKDYVLAYNEPVPLSTYTAAEYETVDDADIYVATDGNDAAPGTLEAPKATFEGALAAVRTLKAEMEAKGEKGEITVAFKGGNYGPLALNMTSEDSGSENIQIKYVRYNNEEVVFDNGFEVKLEEFEPVSEEEKAFFINKYTDKIYRADISDRLDNYDPTTSFILNGNGLCNLARFPNKYKSGEDMLYEHAGYTVDDTHIIINYPLFVKRYPKYHTFDNIILYGYLTTGWYKDTLLTSSFDSETYSFEIADPSKSRAGFLRRLPEFDSYHYNKTAIVNVSEELDTAGEYFIDADTKILYVYDPDSNYVSAAGSENMIRANGVSYLSFEGLTFKNSYLRIWNFDESSHISVKGCSFSGCADDEMVLFSHAKYIDVRNSDFSYCAAYGLQLGGRNTPERYYVDNHFNIENNYFTLTSLVKGNTAALSLGRACKAEVCHNLFQKVYWEGVDFRGCTDTTIEYNIFDRACFNGDDTGAVNNWSSYDKCGNVVRYNIFNQIAGGSNGRFSAYLDDTAGTQIYSNLYYNCDIAVMNNGICKFNTFCNNIVISRNGGLSVAYNTGASEEVLNAIENGSLEDLKSSEGYQRWASAYEYFDAHPEVKEALEANERWKGFFDITTDFSRATDKEFCLTSSLVITGNISFGETNKPSEFSELFLKYSDVEGNMYYTFEDNPFFANPTLGDYRITGDSDFYFPFEEIGRY